jgi:preprotein translocase subunit SecE
MNREFRRLSKKSQAADRPMVRPPAAKRKRTKPLTFVKEVRAELGKVAWPTRKEVFTYTVVVLVSVAFFMAIIGGMDFISSKAVIELIKRGGK